MYLNNQANLTSDVAGPQQPTSECLVVIPTYNERENIGDMISALQGIGERVDILIVDDNSPDGTAALVRQLMQTRSGVYLMCRRAREGWEALTRRALLLPCRKAGCISARWMPISVTIRRTS